MITHPIKPPVKWAAELAHVREVSLRGTADLNFWTDRLAKMGLLPAEQDGQAQVLMIAADARYMGVRFQELSFSVLVSFPQDGARHEGAYLLRAFNSCRSFAFMERVFFSTPYYHGGVRVSDSWPAAIDLVMNQEPVFRAEMAADATATVREPARLGDDGWDGSVFLPAAGSETSGQGKVFFARVRGYTQMFPFLAARDSLTIRPARGSEILQTLVDSRFVGKEWAIRADASHAKSKTYSRTEALRRVTRAEAAEPAAAPDRGGTTA